jgi:hypothetical protein
MKPATELAEEFPILVPNSFPIGSDAATAYKIAYRLRYVRFIEEVQKDAREGLTDIKTLV